MKKAIIAKKLGMTQTFKKDGTMVPVTVLLAGPNYVVQKKTAEKDGYEAIQLGFDSVRESLISKPEKGHLSKAGVKALRRLREFKLEDISGYEIGQALGADVFAEGEAVDVSGVSKGKGFQGVVKRHGQSRGRMTHGSGFHRAPGSMSAHSDPSRVFKHKNLPGHMGSEKVTALNLKVVMVDAEKNVILVQGPVPGANGSIVTVRDSVKA